jgi:hypothetical protein
MNLLPPASDDVAARQAHPYAALTPDVVMDALSSVGLQGDGRLTALSSYENRVYQVHLEDPTTGTAPWSPSSTGPNAGARHRSWKNTPLPASWPPLRSRWSPRWCWKGAPCTRFGGFAFSVSPWRGGRAPELDDFEVLEWIGRFLARIHTVGAARPFTDRPALDVQAFATEPRDWLLAHDMIPLDVQGAWEKACEEAIDLIAEYDAIDALETWPK